MATQSYPFDWRIGAQHIANKWSPDWWGKTAPGLTDTASLQSALQKQLYTIAPTLTPEKYREWLNDYTWLTQNQGRMPEGFTPPANPDPKVTPPGGWTGTTPYLPWLPGGGSGTGGPVDPGFNVDPRNPGNPGGLVPTPRVPGQPGSPNYGIPFPGMDTAPDVWKGLTDAQVQRLLAYMSSALPYAELADSRQRFDTEMGWKKKVDAWGTTGRAQLPSGNTVRRY